MREREGFEWAGIGCVKDIFRVDASATSKRLFMVHGRCLVLGLIDSESSQEPLGISALEGPRQRNIATPKDSGACSLYSYVPTRGISKCLCYSGMLRFGLRFWTVKRSILMADVPSTTDHMCPIHYR